MKVLLLLAVVGVVAAGPWTSPDFEILSDEEIDYINSVQSSWKAGRNFHPEYASIVRRWLNVDIDPAMDSFSQLPIKNFTGVDIPLPDHFDPRDTWTHCPSMHEIRDQGNCASSWAFAAAEAITDRICIQFNHTRNAHMSAADIVACGYVLGCMGGFPANAWIYYNDFGVHSGGPYNSHQGCKPYPFPPCDHFVVGHLNPCYSDYRSPECFERCSNHAFNKSVYDDFHFGKAPYAILKEEDIMKDIYTHGPMEASFIVYPDFLHYKSGVYKRTAKYKLGELSVKIMGWGVENGEKYWLAANSWNADWGDKGFFKILRGVNECGIEAGMVAAIPCIPPNC